MKNDRVLSFLGICKRAGRLLSGADTVSKAVCDGRALLVLAARDLADNSLKGVRRAAEEHGVPLLPLRYTKDELSLALGRHCGVICVTDAGFADKLLDMLSDTHY